MLELNEVKDGRIVRARRSGRYYEKHENMKATVYVIARCSYNRKYRYVATTTIYVLSLDLSPCLYRVDRVFSSICHFQQLTRIGIPLCEQGLFIV